MNCHHFTELTRQYPEEFEALKQRELPAISFSNIFGEEIMTNFYERIRAAGYQADTGSLGAVVEVRRPMGYGGETGSTERVSFFVDWEGDGCFREWLPPGGRASFRASDPECIDETPISYVVSAPGFIPPSHAPSRPCYRLRIVLAWQEKITGPDFVPAWGDRFECRIRLAPTAS
jgi:hypothetical protein